MISLPRRISLPRSISLLLLLLQVSLLSRFMPFITTRFLQQSNHLHHIELSRLRSKSLFFRSKTNHLTAKGAQDGLKEADKVQSLPGQHTDGAPFDQYLVYVTVDPTAGRALLYYFVESAQNSSSKPLVLWLSGGPGCSSLGNGAMIEVGPFKVNSDGQTLKSNPYAWTNVENVLFLESPAGVGFSYSNTTSDYNLSGDMRTAEDSYKFLINWLERFPFYKTSDFFIVGESYLGHFVPQLAQLILHNNEATNSYKYLLSIEATNSVAHFILVLLK